MYVITIIPMMAGSVRSIIDFMPIVALVGSLFEMYMDDNVLATPISTLLKVTISAGENIGDGIVVAALVMVSPCVNYMSMLCDRSRLL